MRVTNADRIPSVPVNRATASAARGRNLGCYRGLFQRGPEVAGKGSCVSYLPALGTSLGTPQASVPRPVRDGRSSTCPEGRGDLPLGFLVNGCFPPHYLPLLDYKLEGACELVDACGLEVWHRVPHVALLRTT